MGSATEMSSVKKTGEKRELMATCEWYGAVQVQSIVNKGHLVLANTASHSSTTELSLSRYKFCFKRSFGESAMTCRRKTD